MNYLLDTCVLSDFLKKIPSVVMRFQASSPKQLHVSAISLMEIEYGLRLNPEREIKIRPIWKHLLQLIQVVPYSAKSAKITADIRASLKKAGLPVGPYDILIAGTAIAHNMVIVTANFNEFKRIPNIRIEDWR